MSVFPPRTTAQKAEAERLREVLDRAAEGLPSITTEASTCPYDLLIAAIHARSRRATTREQQTFTLGVLVGAVAMYIGTLLF